MLKDEGYIAGYSVVKENSFAKLVIELKYTDGRRRVISQVKRVSKPGRRICQEGQSPQSSEDWVRPSSLPRVV